MPDNIGPNPPPVRPNIDFPPPQRVEKPPIQQPPQPTAPSRTTRLSAEEETIRKEIESNPELKKLFNQIIGKFADEPPEVQFNIKRVVFLLIALCHALQEAATVIADRLTKVTELLTGYSTKLTQVPVVMAQQALFSWVGKDANEIYKNEADARALVNQKFSNMLEAVRANKGLEEDKAKKIQTILQTIKDASSSSSDFITAFIDLLRSVSSKINR